MKRTGGLFVLVFLLFGATALRFYHLDAQSFWNDEGNSARLSERSIPLILEGTASDIHPPLYYLLLRGWRELAGDSEFALRSLSAFFGVGLVAVSFALARGWLGRAAALSAAFLVAVNPALVYYSQEARMYEMLAFLAAFSTWLMIRWLQGRNRQPMLLAAFVLSTAAGLYTHYFYPAVLLAQNLVFGSWLLSRRVAGQSSAAGRRSFLHRLGAWLAMMAAAFLLYLPWLPIFLRQTGGRPAERTSLANFLLQSLRWMAFGPTMEAGQSGWPLLAYLLLLALGLVLGWKIIRRGVRFWPTALAGLLVPVLFMWLAGSTRPAFYKFLLVAIPPLALLAGPGWWSLVDGRKNGRERLTRLGGALLLGGLILWGSGRSLDNLYGDPAYARADYRAMAARIAAEDHPNAAVILNAANQWEVFTYYHRKGAPVYPVPTGFPDPAAIHADLSAITAEHDRIYAIFWGEAERDPQRLVERWLDAHAFKAGDEWYSDVRFVTYAVPAEPAGEMATTAELAFGEAIYLKGYTLPSDELRPGDIVELTLFWQALRPLETRYKVFLHLLDDQGRLVAQRDSEPGGGLALTTTWEPGETVVDNHGLLVPAGTPPGEYRLLLGLYELGDPANRLVVTDGETLDDAWPLAGIRIIGQD